MADTPAATPALSGSQAAFAQETAQKTADRLLKEIPGLLGTPAAEKETTAAQQDWRSLISSAEPGSVLRFDGYEVHKPGPQDKTEDHPADGDSRPVSAEAAQALLRPIEQPLNGIDLPGKLPAGAIVVGGGLGIFTAEVIDGWRAPTEPDGSGGTRPNYANVGMKGVAIVGVGVFGGRVMSKDARLTYAAVLGAQVIATMLPVNDWAAKVRGWFMSGSGGTSAQVRAAQHNAAARAQSARQTAGASARSLNAAETSVQNLYGSRRH